jgi:hypothetical protein
MGFIGAKSTPMSTLDTGMYFAATCSLIRENKRDQNNKQTQEQRKVSCCKRQHNVVVFSFYVNVILELIVISIIRLRDCGGELEGFRSARDVKEEHTNHQEQHKDQEQPLQRKENRISCSTGST